MGSLEVLIRKLLAVDRLATCALLLFVSVCLPSSFVQYTTDITTSQVTTLQHELRDDPMEGRAFVAEALLASAESTEILSGLGDYVVVELEVDPTSVSCW